MATLREDLNTLLTLQQIDSETAKTKKEKSFLDTGTKLEQDLRAAQEQAKQTRASEQQTRTALKDAELELSGLERKLKDYEDKMRQSRSTNAREILNMEREINQLTRQRSALDDKILGFMDETDNQQKAAAHAEEVAQDAERRLHTQRETYQATAQRLDERIADLNRRRAETAGLVSDAALLKRYETIRARPGNGGIGIAQVDGNLCGACHTQIGSVDANRARAGEQLTLCENCLRILC